MNPLALADPGAVPRHIAVVGAGLIGASVALACAQRWPAVRLSVSDSDAAAAQTLADRLAVASASSVSDCVMDADMVVLAVPPHALERVAGLVLHATSPSCVVTDVGSVKQPLADWAKTLPLQLQARLVPAHPIAGGPSKGSAHASAGLFVDKAVVVCPLPASAQASVEKVEALWRGIGARVHRLDAASHDQLYAMLSHLPHLLAFSYVDAIAAGCPVQQVAALGGASLHDFTRIGQAQPALWADICVGNRKHVLAALDQFERSLTDLRSKLERHDRVGLESAFAATTGRYAKLFAPAVATPAPVP